MGYITHLRKIFFTYFQYNVQFRYYLPLEKSGVICLNKLEFPPHKDALYQACLKLAQLFWRRWLLKKINLILKVRYYHLLEKAWCLNSFVQTWIPFMQGCFASSLVEIGQVVLRKIKFLNIFNIILQFLYYLHLRKGMALRLNKFVSLYPRIFCAKFGWN